MNGEVDLGTAYHYVFLVLLVAAMLMGNLRNLRMVMLFAGVAATIHYFMQDGMALTTGLAALVAVTALVQLVLQLQRSKHGLLRAEEHELIEEVLQVRAPEDQRHLIGLLEWRDIAPGEVMAREGQECPPLVYVASGSATVTHGDQQVGSCEPGDFVGEMSVLAGDVASATVTAREAMRIALIDRDAMLLLTQDAPDVARAFDRAINRGLAAKLKRMNAARSGEGA
ncbi:MAG: cyclic nucleotide-binding domain-containing protein [Erythrobacter sp.]|nr:cyclic nucleotide-binding domain-containing protein [Erythrobacter sp.]